MDLMQYTEEELRAALAQKERDRRADAIRQLEEIAAKHGFTLADFAGRRPRMNTRAPRGTMRPQVVAMLRAGKSCREISEHFGRGHRYGFVYNDAKSAGIEIKNGKPVLP